MFAVVKTGGKQYRVAKDDIIRVEKLDAEAGATVLLEDVLLISDEAGAKLGSDIADAAVQAEVIDQTRNKKIIVYKKKRRQNYRRKKGHRQHVTILKIVDISLDRAKKKAKAAAKAPAEAAAVPETAGKGAKKASAKKATEKTEASREATAKTAARKTTAKKATRKSAAKKVAAKKPDAE